MRFIPIIIFLLTGCTASTTFSESETTLEKDEVREIIIQRWGKVPGKDEVRMYQQKSQTDPEKISQLLNEINNAVYTGPWESSIWDRVLFVSAQNDTTKFYTNGKIFGRSRTGSFYEFSTPNIYLEYWGIEPKL